MAYFKRNIPCEKYPSEWEALLNFSHSYSDGGWLEFLPALAYPIEAKALSVFTVARRLVKSAQKLAEAIDDKPGERWDLAFVESSIILFPMVELIGYARLGTSNSSSRNLIAGIEWLRQPESLPSGNTIKMMRNDSERISTLGQHMQVHSKEGPLISDVFDTRNYFIHGVKDGDIAYIPDVLNYELPMTIVRESKNAMKIYWNSLKEDDGNEGWVQNLAEADIHPLVIQGSGIYENGLLEPDIITNWLED